MAEPTMKEAPEGEITILKFTLAVFKLHFMWPLRPDRHWRRVRSLIHRVVSAGAILGVSLALLTIYIAIQVGADDVFSNTLAEVSSLGGCTYLYLLTPGVRGRLAAALARLADYRPFGGPPAAFRRTRRLAEALSMVNYSFTLLAVVAHSLLKLSRKPSCELDRRHGGWFVVCGLFSDIMAPFEVTSDPVKYALHAWQFVFYYLPMKGASQLSFSVFEVSQYLKVRMRHLRDMLPQMFDGATALERRRNFYRCVRYHQEVIQLGKTVDDCYRQLMFIHVVMTGFVFGSISNLIIQEHSAADVAHLLAWLVALLIVCSGGQDIIDESAEIRWAMWCSRWPAAEPRLRRDFMFMLAMGGTPLRLRAGDFGTLSYALFGGVIKTSYSIITVFRR